jgi:polygalacturonase
VCNPRTYGAKADGLTKDTTAIQQAIDECERRGGGVVELDAGVYLSAPIILKSNITLQLNQGAVLRGSTDHDDYEAITLFRRIPRKRSECVAYHDSWRWNHRRLGSKLVAGKRRHTE